jgi:hypothetical protein
MKKTISLTATPAARLNSNRLLPKLLLTIWLSAMVLAFGTQPLSGEVDPSACTN